MVFSTLSVGLRSGSCSLFHPQRSEQQPRRSSPYLPLSLSLSFLILTSVTVGPEIGLIFKAPVKSNCHPLEDK